ncbi:hypothetical protein L6452_36073 [Arctium lappa]|uniref:Uncharacterized protein n=1 Tax=Arctium lappa TaxID=4217 RepID=A0ACB8Y9J8_ARCLA|nr:hypothetical protein L6452_36073 [Arctium lappa]
MTSLQDEVNQLKDNMTRNTSQLLFLTSHVEHLTGEVRGLNTKMDSANHLLSQLLVKLNEPTPTPSFTHDDRISLTVAVDFIHQATSSIPDIEGRLEKLEADARRTPVADAAAPTNDDLPRDDDKEGEMISEENTATEAQVAVEEPPSQSEGEKIAEVSTIEVQVPPSSSQGVEEEETMKKKKTRKTLIFKIRMMMTQLMMIMKTPLFGFQQHQLLRPKAFSSVKQGGDKRMLLQFSPVKQFSPLLKGTPSLQIIPTLTADDQIIPTSFNEDDELEEEEDETLLHPRRPSRPAQWSEDELKRRTEMISHLESQRLTIPPQSLLEELNFISEAEYEESVRTERLLPDYRRDADLALKVHASMFKDDKLKENAVVVQAAILKVIEEERTKEKVVSDKSLDWCKQKIDYRSDPMKIVAVTISGRKKKDRTSVTMEITKEDGSSKAMFVSSLEHFGYVECLEFKEALKKSKSTYKGYVEGLIGALINRVVAILIVPSALPPKTKQIKRRPASSSSDNVDVIKNDTSIKFSKEALFRPPPDLSVLDLSLPPGGPFIPGKVLKNPFRIFFRDDEGQLRFQRVSKIPICPLNHLKNLLCLWCTYSPSAEPFKTLIRQESADRRQKGEEVPDYMIKLDVIPEDKFRDKRCSLLNRRGSC